MSKSKLDDRLEDRIVKFTDYAIDKYQFNFDNFKGKSVGVKLIDCGIKGLKLFQYKATKKKYFQQQFWFDGKPNYWSVGEFIKGKFGIKESRTKVVEIMKTHTDDNGLWIKSPKITSKQQKARVKKAELEERKKQLTESISLTRSQPNTNFKNYGTKLINMSNKGYNSYGYHSGQDHNDWPNKYKSTNRGRNIHKKGPYEI